MAHGRGGEKVTSISRVVKTEAENETKNRGGECLDHGNPSYPPQEIAGLIKGY